MKTKIKVTMLKKILAFAVLIMVIGRTYADPIINSFSAYPQSTPGNIIVSTTAATTVELTLNISRGINPTTGSLEGVLLNLNAVLTGGGVADEVLQPAIFVQTSDFNGGTFATKIFNIIIPANKQGRRVYIKYTYTNIVTGSVAGPFFSSTRYNLVLTSTGPTNPPGTDTRIRIVPDQRINSVIYRENDSHVYLPDNTIMTRRYHIGDENGTTQYEYATLKAVDHLGNPVAGTITVEHVAWTPEMTERYSFYVAPVHHILTGRIHVGDENQKTRYRYSVVKFNGRSTSILQTPANGAVTIRFNKESNTGPDEWNKNPPPPTMFLYGRKHDKDENGLTDYFFSNIYVNP